MDSFKTDIARRLGLSPQDVFGKAIPLRDVIAIAPNATNSIDILEAFAGALADFGWDEAVSLPAFTLDNSIDSVIEEIAAQVDAHTQGV